MGSPWTELALTSLGLCLYKKKLPKKSQDYQTPNPRDHLLCYYIYHTYYIYSLEKTEATQPLNKDWMTSIKETSALRKDAPIPNSPSKHTLKTLEKRLQKTSPPVTWLDWIFMSSSQKWEWVIIAVWHTPPQTTEYPVSLCQHKTNEGVLACL